MPRKSVKAQKKSVKVPKKKSVKVPKKSVKVPKKVQIKGMKIEVVGRCQNGKCVFMRRKTPINSSMLRK